MFLRNVGRLPKELHGVMFQKILLCYHNLKSYISCCKLKNSMSSVRKRTIPTERPPLVSEVSVNFLQIEGAT
jgi:hypothetical protein